MSGMNNISGQALSGSDHLRQSIIDILSTPIGSRVMRRDYGSLLFELIDQAGNRSGVMRLIAATADALLRWEKRLQISRIKFNITTGGIATLDIYGIDLSLNTSNNSVELLGLPLNGGAN